MNVTVIRAEADAAARDALRRLVAHHARTGEWDRHLSAAYRTAEAMVDLADEWVREAYDAPESASFDPAEGSWDPLPDVPLAARVVDLGDHFVGMP